MNQPAKSHEPSMEEILASIRRIIADDDAKTAPPAASVESSPPPAPVMAAVAPPPPMPVPPPSPTEFLRDIPAAPPRPIPAPEPEPADILELTEEMRAPEPEPFVAPFTTVDAQSDVVFSEDPVEPAELELERELPEADMPEPAMVMAELPDDDPLEDARQTLSEQMEMNRPLLSRSASVAVDSAFASLTHTVLTQNARTLDDLVKDMLRPMLKAWLDDNLPSLVERLVRAEIERVSRGR
jgi:cell pole-organizing protein PopZ